eukprot:3227876-Pyramimonas_sp.AAC.1
MLVAGGLENALLSSWVGASNLFAECETCGNEFVRRVPSLKSCPKPLRIQVDDDQLPPIAQLSATQTHK